MKTITFYSYKGGVGRSLALSNIAIRLSQLQKKVCVLDFDLDAPGLRFKFPDYTPVKDFTTGIVDYIYQFSSQGTIPSNISDYVVELKSNNINSGPIHFISAGDIVNDEYWKKLSMIKWADLFYSEKGQGIRFFLDLKAKIEKEINPDVLLIDSRTGITDISGITLKLFADEVVVLAVNNKENIFGTKKILKSLLVDSNPLLKRTPKVRFVMTRLPFSDTPRDKEKEFSIIQERKEEIKNDLGLEDLEISVIHSDKRLEERERHLIGIDYIEKTTSVSNDYLKLFDLLTSDLLTSDEIDQFRNYKNAEISYSLAVNEKDLAKRLIYLNKAITLDPKQFKFYYERGLTFWKLRQMAEAVSDLEKVLELNPSSAVAKYGLGALNYNLNNREKAIHYLNQVLNYPIAVLFKARIYEEDGKIDEAVNIINSVIEKYPHLDMAHNAKADALRRAGRYEEALQSVYKAIEIDPDVALYFGTLAEISGAAGNIENFYLNLSVALSKGMSVNAMGTAIEAYEPFFSEKRFLDLMEKYQIKIDDLIASSKDSTVFLDD